MGSKKYFNRLANGQPIISPSENNWENGFTLNATCLKTNKKLVDNNEEIIAVFYRAQPKIDEGFVNPRSSIGLAIFDTDFQLIKRLNEPIIVPDCADDYYGVEDPRIIEFDNIYYLIYCGVNQSLKPQICIAKSQDLLHWEKLGPVHGDVNLNSNKDGVLFPDKIDEHYVMLHRPMIGEYKNYHIHTAISKDIDGEWHDCGEILSPDDNKNFNMRWVGAGTNPISLGDNKYLILYHTGNLLQNERIYTASAAILDLNDFTAAHPIVHVRGKIESLVVPEIEYEKCELEHDILNCVFPCGSYIQDDNLIFTYGGGDTYVLAGSLKLQELIADLQI